MRILRAIRFRLLRGLSFLIALVRFSRFGIFPKESFGKLGSSINIFDGEELLLDLIYSVRSEVDYLSVVYQQRGHWGETYANPHLSRFLAELKKVGLVDEVYEWNDVQKPGDISEFNSLDMQKRQIGLDLALNNGCTHFLNLDNDELYSVSSLKYMKKIMMRPAANFADYSVLRHLQYYRHPFLIRKRKEQEYVLGIFPISKTTKFEYGVRSRFPIDPGRKIAGDKVIEFWRFEACMHHFSYVRRDIRPKLLSAHAREGNLRLIDKVVERYDGYEFPQLALYADGHEVELKKIKTVVSTKHFENDSFELFSKGQSLKQILEL